MKLITGGAYQGKLAFARKEYGLGEDGDWLVHFQSQPAPEYRQDRLYSLLCLLF